MDWKTAAPILENLPGGIGIFRWDGTKAEALYVSTKLLAAIECDDLCQLRERIHEEDADKMKQQFPLLLNETYQMAQDFRVYRENKEDCIWLRLTAKAVPEEAGSLLVYAEVWNVDAEKQTENKLNLAGKTLSSVIENSGIQFWEYDLKENRVYLGLKSREDYKIGKVIERFPLSWIETGYVHPEDVKEYLHMTTKLKNGAKGSCFDARIWNPNIERFEWKRIRYSTIFDEEGEPVSAAATAVDICDFKDSEQTLQAVTEQAGITSWEYDIDNRTIILRESNSGVFEGQYGVVRNIPQALIDQRDVHTEDAEILRQGYQRLFDGENRVKFQCRYWVTRIAQYKWFETCYTVLRDDRGRALKAIGTARDIEEQKCAEEQYQEQLKYMDDVSDGSLIAKGRHNISKNIVEFCVERSPHAIAGDSGEKYEDLVARLIRQPLREEKREELAKILSRKELLENFAKGITNFSIEYERRTKDHKTLWVQTTLRTFMQPGSNDIVCFAYTYDKTSSMQEQQIIKRVADLEYDFLGILDLGSGAFKVVTVNNISHAQDLAKTSNYTDSCQYYVHKNVVPEQQDKVLENLDLTHIIDELNYSDTYFITFSLIEDKGIRQKKIQFAYLDESKEFVMFTQSDITNVYKNEQLHLRRIEAALKEAKEANRAKTDFLSRVSHDLRTPMNAILGLSNLGMESESAAELKSYMEKIQSSGQYLLSLINDTLDVNKIESNRVEIHLSQTNNLSLIEPVVTTGMILAKEKGVIFDVDTSEMIAGTVECDETFIRRILSNLISNAIKFTHPGGTVRLKVRERSLAKSGSEDRVEYGFTVEDNGIGMDDSFMKIMYEPFAQKHDMVNGERGSGLGLTIVKKLVELLGGQIQVESALGKGTVFKIVLEMDKKSSFEGRNQQTLIDAAARGLSGKHVLVCEDHPLNTLVVKRLLVKVGCKVTTAENGEEGVNLFTNSPAETFDAILMDIRMPVMDGLEAAKRIRMLNEDIPIVALSANAYDIDEEKSCEAGMNAHLSKPVEPRLMYETLLKYINLPE